MKKFIHNNRILLLCFVLYVTNISIFSVVYYSIYKNDIKSKKKIKSFLFSKELDAGRIYEDSLSYSYLINENRKKSQELTSVINLLNKYKDSISSTGDLINFNHKNKASLIRDRDKMPIFEFSDEMRFNGFELLIIIGNNVTRSGYSDDISSRIKIYGAENTVVKSFSGGSRFNSIDDFINEYYKLSKNSKDNLSLCIYAVTEYIKLANKELTNLNYEYRINNEKLKTLDAYSSNWNFIDFYYFSTTSLILNTYGDIVPNSSSVRFLLTLESFLNLFILLVFINANFRKDASS